MNLKLKISDDFCCTDVFTVNGIDADSDDFGNQDDAGGNGFGEYGCGDMQFTCKPPSKSVLEKYGISAQEYYEIAEKLEDGLSFGSCCWCA